MKIMIKTKNFPILFICLILVSVFSYGVAAEEAKKDTVELSVEEQEKKALETFQKILELTENTDRTDVLPGIEAAYRDIIDKYPKASINQECYWRLMSLYITDYNPPAYEKAESLYGEFFKIYPDSTLKNMIVDILSNSYYRSAKWEKLLKFHTPVVKKFIELSSGKQSLEKENLTRPQEMFMYSEAKFNLGDLAEAEKGYKIVIALFPGSKESVVSKDRLEEINRRRSKLN